MEYTFWLNQVHNSMIKFGAFYRCSIDQENIRLFHPDDLVTISINSITQCYSKSQGTSVRWGVCLQLDNETVLTVFPVNPLSPGSLNYSEVDAMVAVIQSQKYQRPLPGDIDPNPYKRQLGIKNIPPYARKLNFWEWEAETSPMVYLQKYNPRMVRSLIKIDNYFRPSLYITLAICGIIMMWLLVIQPLLN